MGRLNSAAVLVGLLLVAGVTVHCDDTSGEAPEEEPGVVEMVFSFDTTGSMYPVITKVRRVVADMITRLQSDIPGIRIAVFAHGDWQDAKSQYATKWIDFTTDVNRLQNFVSTVQRTSGGDLPEAYELVLHQVSRELSWTHGSRRSLVMIGDNVPHEADYYANVLNVDWRNETELLKAMGVRIYAIRALDYNSEQFYKTIARKTDGVYLRLDDFSSIIKFIMAISYREHGLEYLEAYEREIRSQGMMTPEMETLFRSLKQNPVRRSTRLQLDPTKRPSTTTAAPVVETKPLVELNTPSGPEIYELHVRSDISYRFATTVIRSSARNTLNVSAEAAFSVILPKAAFISNFTMIIGGVSYPGEVKEKEAAKKTYEAARKRGESAGHVAAAPRETNKFRVTVNVASESSVTFVLVYQELLGRRLGVYNHVIHLDPGRIIPDLQVVVNIDESRDLTYLHVPERRGELLNEVGAHIDNAQAIVTRPGQNKARIVYRPTPEQQKERAAAGMAGRFIVEYDVVRTRDAGEVQIVDGYFVHYMAPDGLPPAPKNIMFVLDTSGSMYHQKLNQLKAAMKTILAELRSGDYFNILHFAGFATYWKPDGLVQASIANKQDAQKWMGRLRAAGGTNIDYALRRAVTMLETHSNATSNSSIPKTSLIIFLTDGQATDGITNTNLILSRVRDLNQQRFTLFSLGFGEGVNFPFLTKLSLQNNGLARKIYADADADLQLQGFYSEVGTPTLSGVRITYLDDSVDNETLSQTDFRNFFDGGEIVVTGQLKGTDLAVLRAQVDANSVSGPWSYGVDTLVADEPSPGAPSAEGLAANVERMWAYLTIKALLKRSLEALPAPEKAALKQKALDLSLKYHFVTPLTSMVVVKPESEEVEDVEDPDAPEEEDDKPSSAAPLSSKSSGSGRAHSYRPSVPPRKSSGRRYHSSPGSASFADSDPHFIVNIRGSSTPICFDVMGTPGQIFSLVYDTKSDIVVNGVIIGKKPRNGPGIKKEKPRTYFGKIALHHGSTSVIFTPQKIRFGKDDIPWRSNTTIDQGSFSLNLVEKNKIKVSIDGATEFVIMRHLVRPDHPVKVSFLGIYIDNDAGLSDEAHGLLGQFKHLVIGVNKDILKVKPKSTAIMRFESDHRSNIVVTAGNRENLAKHEILACWFVHNNGRQLLDGRHLDYLVPHISYRKPPPRLAKKDILDVQ